MLDYLKRVFKTKANLPRKVIVAHRGAHYPDLPENSFLSFDRAVEKGYTSLELDLRKTKDGKIVCFHDISYLGKLISAYTYQELNDLFFEKNKTLPYSKEKLTVPIFTEVIQKYKDKIFLDIELKEAGYEEEVVREVSNNLAYEQFCLKSFYDEIIYKVKVLNEQIITGLLLGEENYTFRKLKNDFFPEKRLLKCRANFVSPHYGLLRAGFLSRMRKIKMPVWVWTVNDEALIRKMLKMDISHIITDNPHLAHEVVNAFERKRR